MTKEEKAAYMREWRRENPDKYAKGNEQVKEYQKTRRRDDPEYKRARYDRQNAARNEKYRNDPERRAKQSATSRRKYAELRAKLIAGYGGKCVCCGESEPKFLEIDHVNGGGAKHYREVCAQTAYYAIIKAGFPADYQCLCANCNKGRFRNGGVCPHRTIDG